MYRRTGGSNIINNGDYTANDIPGIYVYDDSGWNGVVEFIFSGEYWQQLVHNINTTVGS
jgi:hypothetical protein